MAQDTVAKFLIAGAGGRHGATGNLAVRQLLARKQPVRAFVFRADERSEHLAGLGAEIVVGDLHDITAVRGAMRSVARAYFTYPLAERLLHYHTAESAQSHSWGELPMLG
jgi:NAD(P)H dehydrogenase (quinone)